jgi:hypothetical protein
LQEEIPQSNSDRPITVTYVWAYNNYIVYSAIIFMNSETKKDYKGKDPMSPEKITSHDPTAVKRDPEDIKEGVAESEEESKERLRRSGMAKGTDKA